MNLIADFTIVTGIVATLIILIALFHTHRNDLHHQILKVIFVVLFFVALAFYGILHQVKIIILIGFFFYESVGYILGPLLVLYVQSLYQKEEFFWKKNWKHFIPLLIFSIFVAIPLLISLAKGEMAFAYLDKLSAVHFFDFEVLFQAIFLAGYCWISLMRLQQFQHVVKSNFSNLQQKDLSWIRYLVVGFLVVISIDFITSFYELVSDGEDLELGFYTMFPLVAFIVYLGYHGFLQSRILLPEFMLKESGLVEEKKETEKSPHHLSNAKEEEKEALENRLVEILETKKPFLDENLTLGSLAQQLPISDKKLSALLNHHMKTTFYDLINHYRVEEVKSKMTDENFSQYTLLALAFDCGFKSKSSFNRIFKKETGLSPSQYKKQH